MTDPRISVWPPLPFGIYAKGARRDLPFPLESPTCRLFALGRHALFHGVRALGLCPPAEILMPAYNHGSEVESLLQAGLSCRFYEGTPELEPDASELDSLLTPQVKALYLIHYLGFPQDTRRWRAWCDERGLFLIEDAAQAWLATSNGRPVGSLGDIALFCLYKSFGTPDGAALVSSTVELPTLVRKAPWGIGTLARRHGAWVASKSRAVAMLFERLEGSADAYDPVVDFALGDPQTPATAATAILVPRVADVAAAARRRSNYQTLLATLSHLVAPPFDKLPSGASPFAFPLEVDNVPATLARLKSRGVHVSPFWSATHPAIPSERFPSVSARQQRTILLPVHQELSAADVRRMLAALMTEGEAASAAHGAHAIARTPEMR